MAHLSNGILISNKNKWDSDTCNNMDVLPNSYADYNCKNYGKANKSVVTENSSIITWVFGEIKEGWGRGITKRHKEIWGWWCICSLSWVMVLLTRLWNISDCTLEMWYANYASVKLLNVQTILLTQWPEQLNLSLRPEKKTSSQL